MKMRSYLLLTGLALGGLVGGVGSLLGTSAFGPMIGSSEPAPQAERLSRARLNDLKRVERLAEATARRSAQLERQMKELRRDRSQPSAVDRVDRSPAQAALDPLEAQQQALLALRKSDPEAWDALLVEVTQEVLADALAVQASDEAQVAQAEAELDALLGAPEFSGTSAIEVRCSPWLCRFVLEHGSEEDFAAFRDQGMISTGLSGSEGFFEHDPESGQTTLYMAQGSEGLPSAEEALIERVLL